MQLGPDFIVDLGRISNVHWGIISKKEKRNKCASLPLIAEKHPLAKTVQGLDENEDWPLTSTNLGQGSVTSYEMVAPKINMSGEHDS